MGRCLADFGGVTIEVGRDSFTIHYDSGNDPHPVLPLTELDNLSAALLDAQDYVRHRKGRRDPLMCDCLKHPSYCYGATGIEMRACPFAHEETT